MQIVFVAASALLFAGAAVAQVDRQADPRNAAAKVPPVEFRSAFEGYRAYADQELRDWRKSNDEAGAAGGHAGHDQGSSTETSKPRPGKPESSGGPAEKGGEHGGHGGHR